jgi:uroporphyrin-III C-methyltransferase
VKGFVTLVGAGPGDPDLLTVKAVGALAEADLVLYDALVDPAILGLAPRARRFFVGKRRGRHAMPQEAIHQWLVRAARAGERVVRLKAGDPFVFGRGGEEVLALEAAGVAHEVIPGISSAIAGPGAIGVPVTHRGVSSGFLVLSAVPDEGWRSVLPALSKAKLTVVVLMGLDRREVITSTLIGAGWSGEHPTAIVAGAHTARAFGWIGALHALAGVAVPADLPGLLVLGEVVRLGRANVVSLLDEAAIGIGGAA